MEVYEQGPPRKKVKKTVTFHSSVPADVAETVKAVTALKAKKPPKAVFKLPNIKPDFDCTDVIESFNAYFGVYNNNQDNLNLFISKFYESLNKLELNNKIKLLQSIREQLPEDEIKLFDRAFAILGFPLGMFATGFCISKESHSERSGEELSGDFKELKLGKQE